MKTDLFQSCGHCWVFQICWHTEYSTFTASSFRIWNSSAEIPSPPLALFVVMLPKAHLTSHSRMSGSRWVITPCDYLGHEDLFLYNSVYSCHLFLISSASVRSIPFLFFIEHIFARNVPLVSLIFLKTSLVFLLFSSISLHWLLRRLSYLSLLFFGTLLTCFLLVRPKKFSLPFNHPISVPFSPSWQCFCWGDWLDLWVTHLIASPRGCLATVLVLPPEHPICTDENFSKSLSPGSSLA